MIHEKKQQIENWHTSNKDVRNGKQKRESVRKICQSSYIVNRKGATVL